MLQEPWHTEGISVASWPERPCQGALAAGLALDGGESAGYSFA